MWSFVRTLRRLIAERIRYLHYVLKKARRSKRDRADDATIYPLW
jgi:hypothetical protein